MLAKMIMQIIEQTGLQYLNINKATLTLTFGRGKE